MAEPAVVADRLSKRFGALTALKGDAGARSVVAAAGERVISVHCDAAAVDVDRPEDLAALNGKSSS